MAFRFRGNDRPSTVNLRFVGGPDNLRGCSFFQPAVNMKKRLQDDRSGEEPSWLTPASARYASQDSGDL